MLLWLLIASFSSVISLNLSPLQLESKLLSILNSPELLDVGQLKATVKLLEKNRGIPNPTSSPILDGVWRLVYTGNDVVENASPIQRTVTSLKQFKIYQVVNIQSTSTGYLQDGKLNTLPDISNVVCFGDFRLRVTALGSTCYSPLVTPRKGDGKIFGINIFGVSNSLPPRDITERIDFSFKEAQFENKLKSLSNVRIPYPVPFTLLGDEAKGWIDVTYMSETLRLSRGNKGSLFVLQKVDIKNDSDALWASSILTSRKTVSTDIPYTKPLLSTTPSAVGTKPTTNPFSLNTLFNIFKPTSISNDKQSSSSSSTRKKVCVLLPAQLASSSDYIELGEALKSNFNYEYTITPLSFPDWVLGLAPSFLTKEYIQGKLEPSLTLKFYLQKVDIAVKEAMDTYGSDCEITLVGHSIGGWIARAWLSEWASPTLKSQVTGLVSLGSPHQPPPEGSIFSSSDQTRGLLSYINSNFPGAFEKDVKYVSVIGSSVQGELKVNAFSLLAYASYVVLSGNGTSRGDGLIPIETATLPGAALIALDDAAHSNFVPSPLGGIKFVSLPWYGSERAIQQWASRIFV